VSLIIFQLFTKDNIKIQGGFSIGLEAASMQTVAFCEINPFCQKILTRHWPSIPVFPDITIIHKEDLKALPRIDVIAGGFPCQDISVAGKQKGIEAKRSGLWKEFVRLINEIRPKYAIIENVANLRSTGLIRVLQDLWKIGYNAEWHCIPASAFGAPHRRDRIWIVAYPACIGKVGLSCREKTSKSISGGNCKDVFGYKISGLQGNYQFKEVRRVSCEEIRTYRNTKGFAQWGIEPETIPRLTEERLNPDWVEWLMGFPHGWTEGGRRRQRLQSLGNAVVPLIPEFLGEQEFRT
jgi:DNA (cytosine-5)-methyltransferase 1